MPVIKDLDDGAKWLVELLRLGKQNYEEGCEVLLRNGRIQTVGGYYPDEGNRLSQTTYPH